MLWNAASQASYLPRIAFCPTPFCQAPQVVLPMGNRALKSLLPKEFSQLRVLGIKPSRIAHGGWYPLISKLTLELRSSLSSTSGTIRGMGTASPLGGLPTLVLFSLQTSQRGGNRGLQHHRWREDTEYRVLTPRMERVGDCMRKLVQNQV